jgi:choline dehydrogenase-like flavoprotein
MELDARTLDIPALEGDVCIVGAGPAGLTLAGALAARGRRVVLLESGGRTADAAAQALSDGTTSGDPYDGPGPTRHRQAGGTVAIWNTSFEAVTGAKYVPLGPIDLEAREWWPLSGWPIEPVELSRHYARAQSVCGLGPGTYRGEDWADADRPCLALAPGPLVTGVYQFGSDRAFLGTALDAIRRAATVVLCQHATMVGLELDVTRRTLRRIRAASLTGRTLSVHARHFVLASGGIENARLLLLASAAHDLPESSGWLGRCFMEHPRDVSCRLVPSDPSLFDRCGFYDLHRAPGGIVAGHLALSDAARRDQRLPAMSITLQPTPRELAWAAAERLRTRLLGPRDRMRANWWVGPRTSRRYAAFTLLINLEQAPDPDNRVTLGPDRDAFGLPRADVHWRWRARDRESLARQRAVVVDELERHGLGRVLVGADDPPDPNAHHHVGTTRMHADARLGVVDADSRVHGLANLFVTGSSVFPTGGFANPTLTIVALALRLADHLEARLASSA